MSTLRCKTCNSEIDDIRALFCGTCGSILEKKQSSDIADVYYGNFSDTLSRIIGILLIFILIFSLWTFVIYPSLNLNTENTGQFTLKEAEWNTAVTDHLIMQPTNTWIKAGREFIVKAHHLNESDPYLLSITEYTQETEIVAQRWYNITGVVNHTISYYASDFVYLVNNNGNMSFVLYRGTWMNYTEGIGEYSVTYQIINSNDLQYINACYLIPI